MLSRREFLELAAKAGIAATVPGCTPRRTAEAPAEGIVVNDVHSHLNPTRVHDVIRPESIEALQSVVRAARRDRRAVSVAGGRHAMGGQQFAADSTLIDMNGLTRVIEFDRVAGEIEVEAGIQWPQLIDAYLEKQQGLTPQWGVAQKQTGADTFTLGGSLSSNVHGRGLTMKPLISNVESFTLLNAEGKAVRCNRMENPELFRCAIGGYGLFGLITRVTLRLVPRRKLQRKVEIISARELMERFERRIADGFLYGDFQFSIDEKSSDFSRRACFPATSRSRMTRR